MKILNLDGLTNYTIKLLDKVKEMINEKSNEFQKKMVFLDNNSNVLEYAENYPVTHYNGTFFTYRVYNGYGEPYSESAIGSGDYYYYANKLDDKWITIVAIDVRSSNMFLRAKNNGTWNSTWRKISDDGNADTLDGYHGDNYAFIYSNYGANYFNSMDLNNWTRPGEYAIQSGCTNTPTERGEDTWGTMFIVKGLSDRISQYAVFWNESGNPLWHRCLNGSTWSTWKRVRDGGNASTSNSATWSTYMTGWNDERNVNTTPNDYNNKLQVKGLKINSAIGLSSNTTFSTVAGLRAWHDSSGGDSHELAFAGDGEIYQRHGASDSWGSWNRFYTSNNITYGTNSLTSGSSALASGNIYLQYE